jgi:polysaccharide biosynthesis/export protein
MLKDNFESQSSLFQFPALAPFWLRSLVIFGLTALLSACALPRSGPSADDFAHAGKVRSIDLVEVTMADAAAGRAGPLAGFGPEWRTVPASAVETIGVGDVLSIALFERDGLNVFASGPDGSSRFDGLLVDSSGAIELPYIGDVDVAGLTPAQVRMSIVRRLRRVVLAADVTVAVAQRHSQLVSVQGDVARSGMVPLGPESARLAGLLSVAGPNPSDQEFATVTVRRNGSSATVPLATIYEQPADDIALRSGDVVIVRTVPAMVNVLGAAGVQGRVRIIRRGYSVVDAVADARGLNDAVANPASVYLMRLGDPVEVRAAVPRVYHFDFRDPSKIAVAAAFVVRDGDAILVSNAPFTQVYKVLTAFNGVASAARSAAYFTP